MSEIVDREFDDQDVREIFCLITPEKFPIEYFLLSSDGRLLELSPALRNRFNLTPDETLSIELTHFMVGHNRNIHKKMLEILRATAENRQYSLEPLHVRIEGKNWFLKVSAKRLEDPETGNLMGYYGCVLEVSDFYHSQDQLKTLKVGVFNLDMDGKITYANNALADILGFSSHQDLVEKKMSDIFIQGPPSTGENNGDLCGLRIVRAIRQNDAEIILLEINCQKIEVDGEVVGRKGTVTDLTPAGNYLSDLIEVPVGLYEIRRKNDKDEIIACNDHYARMHGYEANTELIGKNVRTFFTSQEAYDEYIQAIHEKDAVGEGLMGYHLKIRNKQGEEVVLEISVKLVKNGRGEIIGRTGAARVITKEYKDEQDLKTLRADIGGMLHSYSSTLLLCKNSIQASVKGHVYDPFARLKPLEAAQIDAEMKKPVSQMNVTLKKLVEIMDADPNSRRFSPLTEPFLRSTTVKLDNLEKPEIILASRYHSHRLIARSIVEHFALNPGSGFPHELIKQLVNEAREVERLACLAWLYQAEADLISTDNTLRALRDFVTTGIRKEEQKQVHFMWDLVKQVMDNLQDYANIRGVEYKIHDRSEGAKVQVVERDILRALTNLLHNAIKYSWSRSPNTNPWIRISLYRDSHFVTVELENFGVPIPKDEIEKDLIFKLGFRGRLSSSKGRLGTGIGLTDSRNTAREYHGDVIVISRPANRNSDPENYNQPFITTVHFKIPYYSGQNWRN